MKGRSLVNTGDISPEIASLGEYRLRRKGRVEEVFKRRRRRHAGDKCTFSTYDIEYLI